MLYLVNDPRYKQYLTGKAKPKVAAKQEVKKEEEPQPSS